MRRGRDEQFGKPLPALTLCFQWRAHQPNRAESFSDLLEALTIGGNLFCDLASQGLDRGEVHFAGHGLRKFPSAGVGEHSASKLLTDQFAP